MNKYLDMEKIRKGFERFGFGRSDATFRERFKRASEEAQGRWIEVDGYGGVEVVE